MQRWHVTLGLTALAVGAALLAPRLAALRTHQDAPATGPDVMVDTIVTTPPALPPVQGDPLGHLTVTAGLDRTAVLAGGDNERFLTITVQAPTDVGVQSRRAVDLSVVVDVSGSMSARGKIDQARRAAKSLASAMEPGDTYSLVVFNDDATVVVPATGVEDVRAIHRAIDRVYEGGGTNLYAGLEKGAREIRGSVRDGAVSRLVVLSDGKANVGVTDPGALSRYAADLSASGISLSTVGLGLDYNEDLLARLADLGGGSYGFVSDASQLTTVFADELARTASVVARQTRVHVELPPNVVPVEVIGWDGVRSGNGWDVFVGDVYSGETRKIVTRVRVTGDASGSHQVADVDATYFDVPDSRDAHTPAQAAAIWTLDRSQIERSVDKQRAVDANRAIGSQLLDLSTRAYERGDRDASRELAAKSSAVLRGAADAYDAPELDEAAAQVEEAAAPMASAPPTTEVGRTRIKQNKELFRDLAR
ncbi:MAG: VWA domain-containing protein [Alphaproteobacteria bacterium]|nr:VWA domain-containing protein [Alphaproteobacteria bacterium]MCB9696545.1 VWA domain-containing protein [Alphaproteobacteria bacterium]